MEVGSQSYKDKGFNVKVKLKDQGDYPALAVGLNILLELGFMPQSIWYQVIR